MINRIREIRRARSLTLAQLAARCDPPTTAQTIGRLETGTRNLSLKWMDRIGAALGVDPEQLVRSDKAERPRVIAELGLSDIEALPVPREAVMPHEIASVGEEASFLVIEVLAAISEYRSGDLVWLRRIETAQPNEAIKAAINRDCLVPRPGGRFAFGRLIDAVPSETGARIGLLPAQSGLKQQIIDSPPWIAVSAMLVRPL